jgi:hypothetical protein
MIENEVVKIFKVKGQKQGKLLNELTDEFRSGRNPWELVRLIDSDNRGLIEVGIYIIREIIIENDDLIEVIIIRLYQLIRHVDKSIRHYSFLLLGSILKEKGSNQEIGLYKKMLLDNDKFIRKTAQRLLDNGYLGSV